MRPVGRLRLLRWIPASVEVDDVSRLREVEPDTSNAQGAHEDAAVGVLLEAPHRLRALLEREAPVQGSDGDARVCGGDGADDQLQGAEVLREDEHLLPWLVEDLLDQLHETHHLAAVLDAPVKALVLSVQERGPMSRPHHGGVVASLLKAVQQREHPSPALQRRHPIVLLDAADVPRSACNRLILFEEASSLRHLLQRHVVLGVVVRALLVVELPHGRRQQRRRRRSRRHRRRELRRRAACVVSLDESLLVDGLQGLLSHGPRRFHCHGLAHFLVQPPLRRGQLHHVGYLDLGRQLDGHVGVALATPEHEGP
mmetsp:Transcript_67387/g.194900  ORF Transcript_67387/g.194900 Transcript_67387/m.194900 type:complete len:312 (+) Transcript_67387:285-1220(+)